MASGSPTRMTPGVEELLQVRRAPGGVVRQFVPDAAYRSMPRGGIGRRDQAPPKWRKLIEQAERYKAKVFPAGKLPIEFQFPELYAFDEAAHHGFYGKGKRAPLPENWERYGRTFTQWEVRGYNVDQLRPGVSPEFLRAQNIRHVDIEEAEITTGVPSDEWRNLDPLF